MKMKSLEALVTTKEFGCAIYTSIEVSDDYSMNEVVNEVRRRGFDSFCLLGTMKRLVKIS